MNEECIHGNLCYKLQHTQECLLYHENNSYTTCDTLDHHTAIYLPVYILIKTKAAVDYTKYTSDDTIKTNVI